MNVTAEDLFAGYESVIANLTGQLALAYAENKALHDRLAAVSNGEMTGGEGNFE